MSRIGKMPVVLPEGTAAEAKGGVLEIKSGGKSAALKILDGVKVDVADGKIVFSVLNDAKQSLANWGTMRALCQNAVRGLIDDFVKELEISGVGFKADVSGDTLALNVGFSHPVKFKIPAGIKASVEKGIIRISGSDRALVGETAAKIRAIKKPEPYKGKGIKYVGEIIKIKAGKKAATAAA